MRRKFEVTIVVEFDDKTEWHSARVERIKEVK